LKVCIDAHTEVKDKALAQGVPKKVVSDSDQVRCSVGGQQAADKQGQAIKITNLDDVIDDRTMEKRRYQLDAGPAQEQNATENQSLPVGEE
jgi:hypothetical protein